MIIASGVFHCTPDAPTSVRIKGHTALAGPRAPGLHEGVSAFIRIFLQGGTAGGLPRHHFRLMRDGIDISEEVSHLAVSTAKIVGGVIRGALGSLRACYTLHQL